MLMRIASIVAIVSFAFSASAEESSVVTPVRAPPHAAKRIEQPPRPVPPHPVQLTNATTLDPSEFGKKHTLLEQKLSEQTALQGEIEQLRSELQAPQQILVRVRMLEVSLTKMRKMGFDANLLSKGYVTVADNNSLRAAAAKMPANPLAKPMNLLDRDATLAFADFLVQNDFGRVLAEPTIVTLAGRPAQFNVGGEFAIPVRDGSTAAVEFRPYGTTMDILAISKGGNVIRMELRLRVSELDESHSFRFGDANIPAVSVRQIDTSVETRANESIALCGMAERRVEKNKNTQTDKQASGEAETESTELLVVVTPELIQPSK